MRILLSAFACAPGSGSEPGVGWAWATELSRDHDVVVLTDTSFRQDIEDENAREPRSSLRFVYVGTGPSSYEGLAIYRYYALWQRRALKAAMGEHSRAPFDLVHHVTYGSHRVSSPLWRLGVPLVFGPVGGGEDAPLRFYAPGVVGVAETPRELVRWASNRLVRVQLGRRRNLMKTAAIAVTTEATAATLPRQTRARTQILPSSTLDSEVVADLRELHPRPGRPTGISALYAGRLLGWKGLRLALHGFARYAAEYPHARLSVFGDGRAERGMRRLACRLGVDDQVSWRGRVARTELLQAYEDHQVFLFPSLHDSSGFVTAEALLAGLPVICLPLGGPGQVTSPATGAIAPVASPAAAVAGIDRGLRDMTDPVKWKEASAAARAAGVEYSKNTSVKAMSRALYSELGLG